MQALNERCQKSQRPNYTYRITSTGPSHRPQFTAVCIEWQEIVGIGATKKEAKEECARLILEEWDDAIDKKTAVERRALEMFTPRCDMHICLHPTDVASGEFVFLDVHYDAIQTREFVCAQVLEPPNKITLFSQIRLLFEFLRKVKKVIAFEFSPICEHIHNVMIIDQAQGKKRTLEEMARIHLGKCLTYNLHDNFLVENSGKFTIKQLTCLRDRVACLEELFAKLNVTKPLI
jgi:hypothetical protein